DNKPDPVARVFPGMDIGIAHAQGLIQAEDVIVIVLVRVRVDPEYPGPAIPHRFTGSSLIYVAVGADVLHLTPVAVGTGTGLTGGNDLRIGQRGVIQDNGLRPALRTGLVPVEFGQSVFIDREGVGIEFPDAGANVYFGFRFV